jgi:hypothetical protein
MFQRWQKLPIWLRATSIVVLAALYVHTFVAGRNAHQREMRAKAERLYARAARLEVDEANWNRELGHPVSARSTRLHPRGPSSGVDWCVPILPGVLLANSYYSVGPLNGSGGQKIVVYYGAGSITVLELLRWVA